MIWRRGYDFIECAYFFRLSRTTVSRVFATWSQFIYKKFTDKGGLISEGIFNFVPSQILNEISVINPLNSYRYTNCKN